MPLTLQRNIAEFGASRYWVQSKHRETALQYLIRGTTLKHEENLAAFPGDPTWAELEGVMPNWAIETLAQGAYMREYHIWEKETKEYLAGQLHRNGFSGNAAKVSTKSKENYLQAVQRLLNDFAVTGLRVEMAEIDGMRAKVNIAKHDPGVLTGHFESTGAKVIHRSGGVWPIASARKCANQTPSVQRNERMAGDVRCGSLSASAACMSS